MSELQSPIIPIKVCPAHRVNAVIIVSALLMFFSFLAVGLRFYTRVFIIKSLGSDDIFILLSLITSVCFCLLLTILAASISGKNYLTSSEMTKVTNMLIGVEAFYVSSIALLKISLGQFFLRILFERWQRIVIYCTMIIFSAFSAAYFFYAIFQCGIPHGSSFWLKKVTGQCSAQVIGVGMGYTHAILTTGSDLVFVCLPIFVVQQSGFRSKEKLVVVGIMSIATVGWIASLIRIKWVPNLWHTGPDYFYNGLNLALWSAVEPGLGIIASSIATLRPLLRKITENLQSGDNTLVSPNKTDEPKSGDLEFASQNSQLPTWKSSVSSTEVTPNASI